MNRKTTSKLISIISSVAAVIMLSSTVSASGILSSSAANGYNIDILKNREKIELANKPFIENGEVYVPLRELMNVLDNNIIVEWQNGIILVYTQESSYLLTIDKKEISINPTGKQAATYAEKADNDVLLKNDTTYIPYSVLGIMFKNPNNPNEVNYAVYDDVKQYDETKVWADALITRDGEPRYNIMTEDMQKQFIQSQKEYVGGEDWNYIIGYSSPWTVSYNIVSLNDMAEITYYQTDSTQEQYIVSERLTFEKADGKILVSGNSECEPMLKSE